jgi:hypothetical protein
METTEYRKSEITKITEYKWMIQDMTGLYIHKMIAAASRDTEVKNLYREMREALLEEGDQPKATQISNQIREKIMINTQERIQ